MFSSRTKLAIRILYELETEKKSAVKITVPDLKRRLGLGVGARDVGLVAYALSNAGMAHSEFSNRYLRFFYSDASRRATLFDLVMAIDGDLSLGTSCIDVDKHLYELPADFTLSNAEAEVRREMELVMRNIPVRSLFPSYQLTVSS